MAQLKCERCGADFKAEDLNVALGVARCSYCGGVFDVGQHTAALSGRPPPGVRPEVPLPEKFEVSSRPSELVVQWRWFGAQYIGLALFCVAWDAFLVFWYSTALRTGQAFSIMTIFPIAHVGVGVGLSYTTLAGFLNRTWIRADRTGLAIRHGPVPWKGNRDLSRAELKQLYSSSKLRQTKNTSTWVYQLNAVTRDGKATPLLSNLESPEQALYLEQQLEKRLEIVDVPVAGELPRG